MATPVDIQHMMVTAIQSIATSNMHLFDTGELENRSIPAKSTAMMGWSCYAYAAVYSVDNKHWTNVLNPDLSDSSKMLSRST